MTDILLEWFYKVKRELPWREERTPYKVWLSEVMLQQTQVKTVIPYFEKWLKVFPSVQDLAHAPLDDVLKQWEGLGYYRRARNLHRASKEIVFDRQGVFPDHYEDWLKLTGVGPYTAAAISSIMHKEAVVAVDGNVKRVASRLFMLSGDLKEKEIKAKLEPFISKNDPGSFNEAMMELGATVCKKRNPDCLDCPLNKHCEAFLAERVHNFPTAKLKAKKPHYDKYALIDIEENKLWLRQRSENEMLNGLWGFVLTDDKPKGPSFKPVKHAYTHFSLEVTPVRQSANTQEGQYIEMSQVEHLALSTLDHKILKSIAELIS